MDVVAAGRGSRIAAVRSIGVGLHRHDQALESHDLLEDHRQTDTAVLSVGNILKRVDAVNDVLDFDRQRLIGKRIRARIKELSHARSDMVTLVVLSIPDLLFTLFSAVDVSVGELEGLAGVHRLTAPLS